MHAAARPKRDRLLSDDEADLVDETYHRPVVEFEGVNDIFDSPYSPYVLRIAEISVFLRSHCSHAEVRHGQDPGMDVRVCK